MNVTVVGAGYVGLVTALGLAELGHEVVCVETDLGKLERLRQAKSTIHEHLVPELLARHLHRRVHFTSSLSDARKTPEAIIICVGTPRAKHGYTDLSAVKEVVRNIARYLQRHTVIVEKSTVPVGTCDVLRTLLHDEGTDPALFSVACNPEFLREGSAVEDFLHPARIVIGTDDERAQFVLRKLYQPLIDPKRGQHGVPLIEVSVKSAELLKHASNAFLAMKISFMNAVANIAESSGADIDEIAAGIGSDPRIGRQCLSVGIGFGGSCFPKDVDELRGISERAGYCFDLLNEVQRINAAQQQLFVDKIREALGSLRGRRVSVLGLSFKPGTDDVRCSPAIAIVKRLVDDGATVVTYDPAAIGNARLALDGYAVGFATNSYESMAGADALVILTDWPEFSCLELHRVRKLLARPIVADGRNLYRRAEMNAAGLTYISVGRATAAPDDAARALRPHRAYLRLPIMSQSCDAHSSLQTSDKSDIEA